MQLKYACQERLKKLWYRNREKTKHVSEEGKNVFPLKRIGVDNLARQSKHMFI